MATGVFMGHLLCALREGKMPPEKPEGPTLQGFFAPQEGERPIHQHTKSAPQVFVTGEANVQPFFLPTL